MLQGSSSRAMRCLFQLFWYFNTDEKLLANNLNETLNWMGKLWTHAWHFKVYCISAQPLVLYRDHLHEIDELILLPLSHSEKSFSLSIWPSLPRWQLLEVKQWWPRMTSLQTKKAKSSCLSDSLTHHHVVLHWQLEKPVVGPPCSPKLQLVLGFCSFNPQHLCFIATIW